MQTQLKDPNKLVRQAALNALAKMDGPIDIGAGRASCCATRTSRSQNRAIDVVVRAKDPDTMKYLVEVLKDENEYARRAAVEVLNDVGTAQAHQAAAAGHQGRRLVGAHARRRRARQDRRAARRGRRASS